MKKVAWKKVSQFEGPEQSPGFLLWQVSTLWRRQIEETLHSINVTHTQFVLLANIAWLTRNNENIAQVDLARQCKTDINMTSQVLRTLEKRGLIERAFLKGNDRSKFLRVTTQGAALVAQAIPLVEAVDNKFFTNLQNDIAQFADLLKKLL